MTIVRRLSWAMTFWMFGCGSQGEKDDKGGKVTTTFQVSRVSEAALRLASEELGGEPSWRLAPNEAVGQSQGSDLEALSYRLQQIGFCGKLVTNGTGTSCAGSGAWSIYSGADNGDYDSYDSAAAHADTANFTNFLDPNALSQLSQDLTYSDGNAQSYDSVTVYWYRPFKVKAKVKMQDGSYLYTKNSADFRCNGANLDKTCETVAPSLTTGPAEEGVFFLPNGGTYLRLAKPFEITADDVSNKTNFKVVLAFDPDNLIKGQSYGGANADGKVFGMRDGSWKLAAPFLQIAPVAARENETIMRETYLLRSQTGFSTPHDIRLSLYFVQEDADRAVRAVTSTIVYNSLTNSTATSDAGLIDTVEVAPDGSLNFKDWMGLKAFGGLVRLTTPGLGTATVISESCTDGNDENGCRGAKKTGTYSYALVSLAQVQATVQAAYTPPPPTTTTTIPAAQLKQ